MYRYSDRLPWATPKNSFSTLLEEVRASGLPLLDLTVSNPTEAFTDYPHSEIAEALGSIDNFRYQPEPFGRMETRAAIVRRMQQRNPGSSISAEHIALTASTSEAYAALFKLLANPGDEVLVPTPSYPLFEYLAQLESVNLKPYKLAYDGSWFIDFRSLAAAVTPKTRAIILVNPNNPTGSFLKQAERRRLFDFALTHSLPLISDEVFMDYGFADSADRTITVNGQHEVLSFVLDGLSKAAGMPQMKLGWIGVNGPLKQREEACARLELVLDTFLSVGAPVQLAIEPLLAIGDTIQKRIRLRLQNNLSRLNALLTGSGVHALNCEGGWSAVLRVPQILSEEGWINRLLHEHGVVVQPGYFFDMADGAFLVISLLTSETAFARGIEQIVAVSRLL